MNTAILPLSNHQLRHFGVEPPATCQDIHPFQSMRRQDEVYTSLDQLKVHFLQTSKIQTDTLQLETFENINTEERVV